MLLNTSALKGRKKKSATKSCLKRLVTTREKKRGGGALSLFLFIRGGGGGEGKSSVVVGRLLVHRPSSMRSNFGEKKERTFISLGGGRRKSRRSNYKEKKKNTRRPLRGEKRKKMVASSRSLHQKKKGRRGNDAGGINPKTKRGRQRERVLGEKGEGGGGGTTLRVPHTR